MAEYYINTDSLKSKSSILKAGDTVYLSGTVYTARDAAHGKLMELIEKNDALPFELNGAVIYYAGPTEAPQGRAIGSCGPTTSCRMDKFTPALLDLGLCAMIGKGNRNREVTNSIIRNKAVYFCAIGGAGALASKCITKMEIIAFEDLGAESIKRLEFEKFPLIVGIDSCGNSLFKE